MSVDASQSDAFVVVVMRDDEPRARIETYVYRPNVIDASSSRADDASRDDDASMTFGSETTVVVFVERLADVARALDARSRKGRSGTFAYDRALARLERDHLREYAAAERVADLAVLGQKYRALRARQSALSTGFGDDELNLALTTMRSSDVVNASTSSRASFA